MIKCVLFILWISGVALVSGQEKEDLIIKAYGNFYGENYTESISDFNNLIENSSKIESKWILQRGIAAYMSDDMESARSDFELAELMDNSESELWIARIFIHEDDAEAAITHLKRYLEKEPFPNLNIVKKDSSFIMLHNTELWLDLWQIEWLSEEQKIIEASDYYVKTDDFDKAHFLIESNEKYNESAYLHAQNSKIYYREGITGLALNEVEAALMKDPGNANYLKLKAKYQWELGKSKEAEYSYGQVLKSVPEDFDSRISRIEVLLANGNYLQAESDVEILTTYSDSRELIFLAGRVFYSSEKYLQALKIFNQLMSQGTPDAQLYRLRGLTYFKTGTYKFAASDLSMCLDLDPTNSEANLYLGLSEYHMGNDKLACYYLNRAKNYGDKHADEFLQKYCK